MLKNAITLKGKKWIVKKIYKIKSIQQTSRNTKDDVKALRSKQLQIENQQVNSDEETENDEKIKLKQSGMYKVGTRIELRVSIQFCGNEARLGKYRIKQEKNGYDAKANS